MRRLITCLLSAGAFFSCAQQLPAQFDSPLPGQSQAAAPLKGAVDSPQLRKLSVPASQTRSLANALSMRYQNSPGVVISPDPKNQHLVVMAPEQTQNKIAAEVRNLLANGGIQTTSATTQGPLHVALAHIDWRTFESHLATAAGGHLPVTTSRDGKTASYQLSAAPFQGTVVQVNRQNNSVEVRSPNESKASWRKLIAGLDAESLNDGRISALVRVENAEPAPIQRAVTLLRRLTPQGSAQPTKPKRKSIFRNAVFQQPAGGDDTGPAPKDDGEGAGQGIIGEADIQFIPELGQIIIKGTGRDVARIKEIIADIEKASAVTKPEVKVVQLNHADCNAVEALLTQLYEDVLSARQGQVSITSLDSPNALLLIGRAEAIGSVEDLIAKIDLPVEPTSRLRVFRLQNASAVDAQETINNFFTNQPGGDGEARPGLGPRVRVLADFRTNSLVVSAAPRDMTEVTRLINDLDVIEITASNEIRVFPLSNAGAETLAETLQAAITGEGDGNDNVTAASTSLRMVAVDGEGNQIIDSGILSGATVTADTGVNAVVVRAPSSSMPLISELIRQLDKAPGIDSLVKVFTIENGDATQLTTALETLFGDTTSGTTIGAGNVAALPSASASGDSTLIPLRFSTDIRTNSIVASGSAADLEVVESILLRLDSEGFAERITEVIWLQQNDAVLVATAVTNYINARQAGSNNINQFQQGLGPFDLLDRDVIAIAEEQTNSLLLSVSPRLYEEIRRLIDRLDRRRPMVMIKVLMAEVTLDDTFEIGGELGLQDSLVFNRGLAVGSIPGATAPGVPGFDFNGAGVTNVNSSARDAFAAGGVSTFGLGTTNPSIGYGGFVLNAASESVSLLMRTLQEANRLQVLSRPQMMTMDNNESILRVGRQVARVRDIANTNTGVTVSTEDIDVGMILRILPRVGADGLIRMNVDVTSSARDPASGTLVPTGAGGTVFIDDIIDTTAQSTLSVYSGQTVVFGGLIQKTRGNISRRVPIVADIPLLGNLFKYDTETETRSELLLVMTPLIVDGEQDLNYVKETESRRMSWCLADVVEAHGDVGLSGGYGLWGPAVGNTIYPDIHPTVENEVIVSDEAIGAPAHAPHTVDQPHHQSMHHQPMTQSRATPPANGGSTTRSVQGNTSVPSYQQPIVVEQPTSQQRLPAPLIEAVPSELPGGDRFVPSPNDGSSNATGAAKPQIGQSAASPSSVRQSIYAGAVKTESAKPASMTMPVNWQTPIAKPRKSRATGLTPTRIGASTIAAPSTESGNRANGATQGSLPQSIQQKSAGFSMPVTAQTNDVLPTISPRSWIQ